MDSKPTKVGLIVAFLFLCLCANSATPSFSDFDPTQFQLSPTGPQPKITLLQGGFVTNYVIQNITNIILVSSNIYTTNTYTTNITAETVNNVTNISQTTIVTNQYVTLQYVTNQYVTYLTASNANISGYLRNALDNGTNETFWGSTMFQGDVYFIGPGAPVLDLINGDTGIGQAGFDGTEWYGNGGGLTNLFVTGVVTNQVPATNVFSGGVLSTNTLSATAGVNGWVLGQSNAAPVWTQNGAGLTNLVYQYPTNVTGNGIFAMQKEYYTNFSANITLGTPTLSAAFYESVAVFCTNSDSAVHSVTCATGILGPPGSGNPAVFFVTNGANSYSWIYFEHHGGIISAKAQPYAP